MKSSTKPNRKTNHMETPKKITSPKELFAATEKEFRGIPSDYEATVTLQDLGGKMVRDNERVFVDITPAGNKYCGVLSLGLILEDKNDFSMRKRVYFSVSCTKSGQGEKDVLYGFLEETQEELHHFLNTVLYYLAATKPRFLCSGLSRNLVMHNIHHHNEWEVTICDNSDLGATRMVIDAALDELKREGVHATVRRINTDDSHGDARCNMGAGRIIKVAHTFRDSSGKLVTVWADQRGRARVKTRGKDYEITRRNTRDIYLAVKKLAEGKLEELLSYDLPAVLQPIETTRDKEQWEFLPEWARYEYGWEKLTSETFVDMPQLMDLLKSRLEYVGRAHDIKTSAVSKTMRLNASDWYADHIIEVTSRRTINDATPTMVIHVKTEEPSGYRDMVTIETTVHYGENDFPDVENVAAILVPHNALNIYSVIHELILIFNNCVKRSAGTDETSVSYLAHAMAQEAYAQVPKISPESQHRITNAVHLLNLALSEVYGHASKEPELRVHMPVKALRRGDIIINMSSKTTEGAVIVSGHATPTLTSKADRTPLTVRETPTHGEVVDLVDELVELLKDPPLDNRQDI